MTQQTLFNGLQHQLTSDDYYTPKWIFDKLQITFDIDVAAPIGGCHWIPAKHHFNQETNGLTSPWYGNVFMNPPFSKPQPWVDKFMQHANGIAVLPMAKSKWFDQIWAHQNAIVVLPWNHKYVDPKGSNGSIYMASILVAYGQQNITALQNIGYVRT